MINRNKPVTPPPGPEISLVIPCYNEGERIETFIREWEETLASVTHDFEILVINDGSSDGTGRILDRLRKEIRGLRVIHQLNSGHDSAVRRGYELARGQFILQVDANGRYETAPFLAMWAQRNHFPLILGNRSYRIDSILRRLLDRVLAYVLHWFFDIQIRDPNVPYRLFRRDVAVPYLQKLTPGFRSTNLLLAVMIKRDLPAGVGEVPIPVLSYRPGHRRPGPKALFGQSLTFFWELFNLRMQILSHWIRYRYFPLQPARS